MTWAEPGVGAVATQSVAEPAYGPRGLGPMRLDVDPITAMTALTKADGDEARRQVAFVDATGRVAVHTGALCVEAAGGATGDGVSVRANMMRRAGVWPAMLEAFGAATGPLADRLMVALDAHISTRERGWSDLLRRLPAADLLRNGDATVTALLGS